MLLWKWQRIRVAQHKRQLASRSHNLRSAQSAVGSVVQRESVGGDGGATRTFNVSYADAVQLNTCDEYGQLSLHGIVSW